MEVINPFKLCSCLKFLGYFMILLVFAIVAVSYYAIVVLTWGPKLLVGGINSFLAFFIIILFHVLLFLLSWSYFMVLLEDPGSVPENWILTSEAENMEAGSSSLPEHAPTEAATYSSLDGGGRRPTAYCRQCQNGKPPRCHHCSVCQRCVLKMDHHCIWVVNCVGARNYKFFLLFLVKSQPNARLLARVFCLSTSVREKYCAFFSSSFFPWKYGSRVIAIGLHYVLLKHVMGVVFRMTSSCIGQDDRLLIDVTFISLVMVNLVMYCFVSMPEEDQYNL